MIKFNAYFFALINEALFNLEADPASDGEQILENNKKFIHLKDKSLIDLEQKIKKTIDENRASRRSAFESMIPALKEVLQELECNVSVLELNRIIDSHKEDRSYNYSDVSKLKERIQDELSLKNFLYIPSDKIKFYDKANKLYGDEVLGAFPEILDDVEGAGRCLALGEGTASVMHLMRVMEVGLKKLSSSLGIPYAPSWESHIKQIQKKIDERHSEKTEEWKKKEKFYRDVSGDLITIKQAWRNPTMHIDRKYSPGEAQEIFNAVKILIIKLSKEFTS